MRRKHDHRARTCKRRVLKCLASIAASVLLLGGCASSPEATPEAMPAGMALLEVRRTSDLLYASVKANVDANGTRVAELARDDGYSSPIPATRTTVSAWAASPPGRYSIAFNAEAGKTYRIVVSPRQEGYAPPKTSGKIGTTDYSLTENDGAFKIEPAAPPRR